MFEPLNVLALSSHSERSKELIMKHMKQNYLALFALITLSAACGKSRGLSTDTDPAASNQITPTRHWVRELKAQTSLGDTTLEVYVGQKSPDQGTPIGTLSAKVLKQVFTQNPDGDPFVENTIEPQAETYPVYLTSAASGQARMEVWVGDGLIAKMKKPLISLIHHEFVKSESFCKHFTEVAPLLGTIEFDCDFPDNSSPECSVVSGFRGFDNNAGAAYQRLQNLLNHPAPADSTTPSPSVTCTNRGTGYPKKQEVDDSEKLVALQIAVDANASSVRMQSFDPATGALLAPMLVQISETELEFSL